ncbi:hypothetical protein PMAYCL1PPCAC_10957, partial [Pristionchus mayeri]
IQHFECGANALLRSYAQHKIRSCHYAVIDGANLCCKVHDLCYDVHSQRRYTREYCDQRFCNCLQDIRDKAKNYDCAPNLNPFCSAVTNLGWWAFDAGLVAVPTDHSDVFSEFVDYCPFGVNMQRLLDACPYAKKIAVHCHNSAVRCLQKNHERFKKINNSKVHSYDDCRSTMFDCLQTIIES